MPKMKGVPLTQTHRALFYRIWELCLEHHLDVQDTCQLITTPRQFTVLHARGWFRDGPLVPYRIVGEQVGGTPQAAYKAELLALQRITKSLGAYHHSKRLAQTQEDHSSVQISPPRRKVPKGGPGHRRPVLHGEGKTCLACDELFASWGPENKLCQDCRKARGLEEYE